MRLFVLLMGFPGVGKLTIARELSPLLAAKVIDNHWFNNPILRLLDDDGTTPLPNGIWEYTGRVRQAVLDAIVAYGPPSANFIFTHAGTDGDERSLRTFEQIAGAARQCEALLVPERLLCDEEELARRVATPARRERLKSIDVQASGEKSRRSQVLDPRHQFTLNLDVTLKTAEASAAAIHHHILSIAAGDFGSLQSNRGMTGQIEIQYALRKEAAAISELVQNTIRVSNAMDYPAEVIERVVGKFSHEAVLGLMENRVVWIARQGDEIVGTASLDGDTVRTVFVSPMAQGQGVGRRLMETMEAAAREAGIEVLRVPASLTARNFYARLGYDEVREVLYGQERTFLMEKQIA